MTPHPQREEQRGIEAVSVMEKLTAAIEERTMGWQDRGICKGLDPDIWFPSDEGDPNPAKKICALCPVKLECRDYALKNREQYGVWGGLSAPDRRRYWKRGVSLFERRCSRCGEIFETPRRRQMECDLCFVWTEDGRRVRNNEARQKARALARKQAMSQGKPSSEPQTSSATVSA
jgi:WhiB family transcriptional regulator, redox-sensing transcriptional regulator